MPNTPVGSIGYNVQQSTPGGGLMSGVGVGGSGVYQYIPPKEHLVSGQMQQLMNPQGRYIGQARQTAMELANARGQANSSYAAGSAERAAIDAALPIAAQDSETLTRIGLANANAAQDYNQMLTQLEAERASRGGQMIVDTSGQEERQMQHDLQMQRERLAFEGEQGAYGRQQQQSMGLFDLYGNLYQGQQNFGNQRQLGFDQYGFQRGLNDQNYGMDLGRMGAQFGYTGALNQQQADLGLRSDYANYGMSLGRDRANLYNNIMLRGMDNPEFMANPEAFFGFTQYATGGVMGAGSSFWDSLFGGGGRG